MSTPGAGLPAAADAAMGNFTGTLWSGLVLAAALTLCPSPAHRTAKAQGARSEPWRIQRFSVPGLTGTPASLRIRVHRVLLAAGVAVREVAPCECLLTSERMWIPGMAAGIALVVRVHLLRPANVVTATAHIEVLEGSASAQNPVVSLIAEDSVGLSAPAARLLDRLRQDLQANASRR